MPEGSLEREVYFSIVVIHEGIVYLMTNIIACALEYKPNWRVLG